MSRPRVRVVGLGPGDARHLTARSAQLLSESPVVRLRTAVHPAAATLTAMSYDDWYERAESFDDLYHDIVEDLARLAHEAEGGEVVYAVPGSPVVAERTVELLRERRDLEVVCEPAVSVIDVACAALGVDPMAEGLRVIDALESTAPLRGPGPLLVLQTYAPEVLAVVADRLPRGTEVVVLHHLGLDDEHLVRVPAEDLASFVDADHLTSLYVEGLRDAGVAMGDLVEVTRELRARCPWDVEQTHGSLARYLVEESYEALDALSDLAAMEERGEDDDAVIDHAEEELGDLLFQIVFHAELGDEEGRFNLATIVDAERDKLIGRHPHVFGDAEVADAAEVEARWEELKRTREGRQSVLEGVVWHLPALALYAKLLRKARAVGAEVDAGRGEDLVEELVDLCRRAAGEGVDLESALRARALVLRDEIVRIEDRAPEDDDTRG